MPASHGHVDLDRQFSPLAPASNQEESAFASYLTHPSRSRGSIGWTELLKNQLVVILGEPGSGKTWEVRHQAEALKAAGIPVFSLQLERLIDHRVEDLLSAADAALFNQWLSETRFAYFFLDSVDEAKLRRPTDFHHALDSFRRSLSDHAAARASMVVTSRVSEWQPTTDRQELRRRFCAPEARMARTSELTASGNSSPPRDISVFQLDPLNRDQVEMLVTELELADAQQFLDALDSHFVWEFARRPIDVFGLAQFWKANSRLGTLTEILEHDVATKSRETTERRGESSLSFERVRQGSEFLAAGSVLCRTPNFRVADDAFVASDSLDPTGCVPESWTAREVAELLSRALFDGATYGHIRFHHRRIAEYLASQWIRRRMSEGCPTNALKDVLATSSGDQVTLRRSLIPLTAWLCAGEERWNQDVRAWVLASAPEIHLQYGDPSALPIAYRRELLQSWIESHHGRESVWVESSADILGRLAAPELANDINRSLENEANSLDVRSELVQLVRYGRITECLPRLIAILRDEDGSDQLKTYAMAAIRDMGTAESRRDAWSALESLVTISNGLCSIACEALYPQSISAEQLARLLEKTELSGDEHHSLLWALKRHLPRHVEPGEAVELLIQLCKLVRTGPYVTVSGENTQISARFRWVVELLPTVVLLLLERDALDSSEVHASGLGLSLISEARRFNHLDAETRDELSSSSRDHPSVRREFFWRVAERVMKTERGRHPHVLLCFDFGEVLTPCEADVAWLCDDMAERPDLQERTLALKAALELVPARDRSGRRHLRRAATNDAALLRIFQADRSIRRWAWYYRLRYFVADRSWHYRLLRWRHHLAEKRRFLLDQLYLHRKCAALRRGELTRALGLLCREAEHTEQKWAPTLWDNVQKKRGRRITMAARAGCKTAWRGFEPELPHEKAEPNRIDQRTVIGLAGLEAATRDDKAFSQRLSSEEARLAVRYAVNEMNGFPEWLPAMQSHHEKCVAYVLNECVQGEWNYPAERQHVHDVISRLSRQGGELARLVSQQVLACFSEGDPPNRIVLDDALTLLLKVMEPQAIALGNLALARCRELDLNADAFVIWTSVALQLDADAMLDVLEERLTISNLADRLFLDLCGVLGGDLRPRVPSIPSPDYHRGKPLGRLIPMVFRHVRPADDIIRGRGPYTPTQRDEAQRFRDGLLSRLMESEDPEATVALSALLDEPATTSRQDWIRHLVNKRASTLSDGNAWTEADVRQFAHDYETYPKSDLELYRIAANRLNDIKLDIEKSDNSLREEVPFKSQEQVLRRWLARKLSERSRDRFTVPQEEEIDQKERPDLRVETPTTPPVSIEVKWAENWAFDQLSEGLRSQLVGQYLRAHNSRCGIYVVAIDGRGKRSWRDPSGQLVKFGELIRQLRSECDRIAASDSNVSRLSVVSLDFRRP